MGANAQTSVPAFTAGQVLTAAQMTQVNTGIPVFASSTERDAAFGGTGEKTLAEGQMAYLEDTNATQYYDGSAWTAIAGGKILQVVSTTKTDTFSASISAGSDTAITGLSATITPSSTSSKILVLLNVSGARSGDEAILNLRLYRGATEIGSGAADGNRTTVLVGNIDVASESSTITTVSGHYLDSPSTTSSITYAVHATNANASNTYTFYINRSATDTDTANFTRTGSSITVLEVSG